LRGRESITRLRSKKLRRAGEDDDEDEDDDDWRGTVSRGCARGASPQAVIFWAFSPGESEKGRGQRTRTEGAVIWCFRVSVFRCGTTPFGIGGSLAFLPKVAAAATLGWRAKSRWDFQKMRKKEDGGRKEKGEIGKARKQENGGWITAKSAKRTKCFGLRGKGIDFSPSLKKATAGKRGRRRGRGRLEFGHCLHLRIDIG